MTGEENNSFEALLGDVLRDSVNTEPRAGIEQRILSHVHAEHLPLRHLPWRRLAIALPLIALAALIITHQKKVSRQNEPLGTAAVATTSPITLASQPRTAAQHSAMRSPAVQAQSPMQSVFPAPAAPAVEGLRLAEWSHQHPQEASHLLILQQEDSATEALKIEPIRIAAIEVSPIDTPTVDQGDSQ